MLFFIWENWGIEGLSDNITCWCGLLLWQCVWNIFKISPLNALQQLFSAVTSSQLFSGSHAILRLSFTSCHLHKMNFGVTHQLQDLFLLPSILQFPHFSGMMIRPYCLTPTIVQLLCPVGWWSVTLLKKFGSAVGFIAALENQAAY